MQTARQDEEYRRFWIEWMDPPANLKMISGARTIVNCGDNVLVEVDVLTNAVVGFHQIVRRVLH